MSKNEISEKLQALCRDIFEDDSLIITDDTTSEDVDMWDSLTHVMLVSAIEKTYGIKFKLDEIQKSKNIGELIGIIESKVK